MRSSFEKTSLEVEWITKENGWKLLKLCHVLGMYAKRCWKKIEGGTREKSQIPLRAICQWHHQKPCYSEGELPKLHGWGGWILLDLRIICFLCWKYHIAFYTCLINTSHKGKHHKHNTHNLTWFSPKCLHPQIRRDQIYYEQYCNTIFWMEKLQILFHYNLCMDKIANAFPLLLQLVADKVANTSLQQYSQFHLSHSHTANIYLI